MKFKSLFDYKYFVSSVKHSIIDESVLQDLTSGSREIEDSTYCLLQDTQDSYIQELKLHSKGKTFYKELNVDSLTVGNVKNMYSLLTHLSIGMQRRTEVRSDVNLKDFKALSEKVHGLIDSVLKYNTCPNTLQDLLF